MGKWGKYKKRYNPAWEKEETFKGWLSLAPKELTDIGQGEAYCSLCKVAIRAHKNDLLKHKSSKSHSSRAEALISNKQPKLASFGVSSASVNGKEDDLRLAAYIGAHSTTRSVDHLGELIKNAGKGSRLEHLKLHRTKCSKLIQNVIAPAFLEAIVLDVGNKPFSIILDESTDIEAEKYMAYVICYFSDRLNNIVSHFLGFQEVERATADILYNRFLEFFDSIHININNMVGLGTDGASNLCGVNHSLYTKLRQKLPNLILVRCVCHSLNRCAAKACEELPSALEFLLRESRNWFSHSSLRSHVYKEIYSLLNNDKQPPKLAQLSATRWLAHYAAVKTMVDQWLELKTHFQLMAQDKCYTARTLAQMFEDDTNYLYLVFLRQALKEITECNLVFQASNADPSKVYSDLRGLLFSFASRIFKPSYLRRSYIKSSSSVGMLEQDDLNLVNTALEKAGASFENSLLPITEVVFGRAFEQHAAQLTVRPQELLAVKERIVSFIKVLCQQIVMRMPENVATMQGLRHLTPSASLSNCRSAFEDLPLELAGSNADYESLESQWRLLGTMDLKDIAPGANIENMSMVDFWIAVGKIKNAAGRLILHELAEFALRALTLPTSNAVVERVFSIMGVVKTKLRNRMARTMLVAILRIRTLMQVSNVCCQTFTTSKKMLELFNSNMYGKGAEGSQSNSEEADCYDEVAEALDNYEKIS